MAVLLINKYHRRYISMVRETGIMKNDDTPVLLSIDGSSYRRNAPVIVCGSVDSARASRVGGHISCFHERLQLK